MEIGAALQVLPTGVRLRLQCRLILFQHVAIKRMNINIHWICHYSVDKLLLIGLDGTCPLNSDIFAG